MSDTATPKVAPLVIEQRGYVVGMEQERPKNPRFGLFFVNMTTDKLEQWNGEGWAIAAAPSGDFQFAPGTPTIRSGAIRGFFGGPGGGGNGGGGASGPGTVVSNGGSNPDGSPAGNGVNPGSNAMGNPPNFAFGGSGGGSGTSATIVPGATSLVISLLVPHSPSGRKKWQMGFWCAACVTSTSPVIIHQTLKANGAVIAVYDGDGFSTPNPLASPSPIYMLNANAISNLSGTPDPFLVEWYIKNNGLANLVFHGNTLMQYDFAGI